LPTKHFFGVVNFFSIIYGFDGGALELLGSSVSVSLSVCQLSFVIRCLPVKPIKY